MGGTNANRTDKVTMVTPTVTGIASGSVRIVRDGNICLLMADVIPQSTTTRMSITLPQGYRSAYSGYFMMGNYINSGYAVGYMVSTEAYCTGFPNTNGTFARIPYITNDAPVGGGGIN